MTHIHSNYVCPKRCHVVDIVESPVGRKKKNIGQGLTAVLDLDEIVFLCRVTAKNVPCQSDKSEAQKSYRPKGCYCHNILAWSTLSYQSNTGKILSWFNGLFSQMHINVYCLRASCNGPCTVTVLAFSDFPSACTCDVAAVRPFPGTNKRNFSPFIADSFGNGGVDTPNDFSVYAARFTFTYCLD